MFELSPHAKLLRMLMRDLVSREDDDGVGWLDTESGCPITSVGLGRFSGLDPEQVATALSELRTHGLVVYADGRFSMPLWGCEQDGDSPRTFSQKGGATSVYAIQAGMDGPVKIGVSVAPLSRMAQMQTGMPETLRILAFIPGTRDDERNLHVRLAKHRIRGEWFHPHPDVLDAFRIS
jgi:hypothetical protein